MWAGIYAINPSSMIDESLMLNYYDRDTGLGVTEQLYTARGSQGLGTFDDIDNYGVNPSNFFELVMLLYK